MNKLKELVKAYHIKTLKNDTYPLLNKLKTDYKNTYKIPHYNFVYRERMTFSVGMKIADAYEVGVNNPQSKVVKVAYKALAKEILQQFYFIIREMDIEFEPYDGQGEPYENSLEMVKDIYNYHMYFFKTTNGFGKDVLDFNNPMLQNTGICIKGYELLVNDVFRIVHDIFGHATYGYSFGPIGEDLAWVTHIRMLSPLARAAMTTETRGQNCWVNFGKHLRDKNNELYTKGNYGWVPPAERPFAAQKIMLLPKEVSGVDVFEKDGQVQAVIIDNWDPFLSLTLKNINNHEHIS
ncbi:hypothetical protein [Aureispira sp. CCB-E]|uniref:hypothetical protein n=1 Tax=Aureispira sp. CCB-E TaxID=3051121 RepID=UPI0028691006|nr:hypothetical protein [Aureispira sp. CCB-E]WMX15750.1 hypothetical protein QP953_05055 [Aureispira sp. CCB-E]